jgi:hypothetical protein
MKHSNQLLSGDPQPESPDWHAIADDRLAKLVQLEHECTVTHGRLGAMQAERHEWEARHAEELRGTRAQCQALVAEVEQLETELANSEAACQQATRECARLRDELAAVRSEFMRSTSWRITAPLRALSTLRRRGRAPR